MFLTCVQRQWAGLSRGSSLLSNSKALVLVSHKSALSLVRLHGILLINLLEATSSLLTQELRGPTTVGGQLSHDHTNSGTSPIRLREYSQFSVSERSHHFACISLIICRNSSNSLISFSVFIKNFSFNVFFSLESK